MTLRYRPLGGTGIEVSSYCLGAMMFGSEGNADHDECIRVIHTVLDAGINFVDTADAYGEDGESEVIVGNALRGRRDDIVLATKVHFPMGDGPNRSGNSRRWITRAVEESLRRLETDWIDLYQVHRPDPTTEVKETLAVLSDLVHQGKIRAFGCSTFPARGDRRGTYRRETARVAALSHRAAAVLDSDAWHRAFGAPGGPAPSDGRADLEPARLGLPDRSHPPRRRHRPDPWARASQPEPIRRGPAGESAQARRGRGADRARRRRGLHVAAAGGRISAGASGRQVGHPRPAHAAQLDDLLAGSQVELDDKTLDRIDEIVPPGTDLLDLTWKPPSLTDPSARRRPPADRSAAG